MKREISSEGWPANYGKIEQCPVSDRLTLYKNPKFDEHLNVKDEVNKRTDTIDFEESTGNKTEEEEEEKNKKRKKKLVQRDQKLDPLSSVGFKYSEDKMKLDKIKEKIDGLRQRYAAANPMPMSDPGDKYSKGSEGPTGTWAQYFSSDSGSTTEPVGNLITKGQQAAKDTPAYAMKDGDGAGTSSAIQSAPGDMQLADSMKKMGAREMLKEAKDLYEMVAAKYADEMDLVKNIHGKLTEMVQKEGDTLSPTKIAEVIANEVVAPYLKEAAGIGDLPIPGKEDKPGLPAGLDKGGPPGSPIPPKPKTDDGINKEILSILKKIADKLDVDITPGGPPGLDKSGPSGPPGPPGLSGPPAGLDKTGPPAGLGPDKMASEVEEKTSEEEAKEAAAVEGITEKGEGGKADGAESDVNAAVADKVQTPGGEGETKTKTSEEKLAERSAEKAEVIELLLSARREIFGEYNVKNERVKLHTMNSEELKEYARGLKSAQNMKIETEERKAEVDNQKTASAGEVSAVNLGDALIDGPKAMAERIILTKGSEDSSSFPF